ncbi:trypsin-like peptidase domain-containing protein [Myxococcota bacterium]|nr:trypsin-like peptidase domain-containing protein [Myxococcota bacterium]MBU1412699.1 trypsin-like peptidase domain-containing protein [Myxococcota bacterium]MBU1511524.1 trypsin-like peptidase domain-containing protein [Myxococcota bacterium]
MKRLLPVIAGSALLSSLLTAAAFYFFIPRLPGAPTSEPSTQPTASVPGSNLFSRPPGTTPPAATRNFGPDFSVLVEKLKPSVVHISATSGERVSRRLPGYPGTSEDGSLGTGIIIRADGLIVTNYHVIQGAARIQVKLSDGMQYPAFLKGRDAQTDLALIQIRAQNLPVAPLGDSDAIPVGAWVVAVGNPFGLEHTTTAGILSAKNRKEITPGANNYWSLLQTDAAINPGNSGGPLINMQGEVIGINTLVDTRGPGIGYAIPSNIVKEIIPHLEKYGSVARSYLGVHVQSITPELAQQYKYPHPKGAIVVKLAADGPAAKAGLREGDIITEFNGKAIEDDNEIAWEASIAGIGKSIEMKVFRDHKFRTFSVTMASHPGNAGDRGATDPVASNAAFGIQVQNVSVGIGNNTKVMVVSVQADSVGERHGIRQGDIILNVGKSPVRTILEYTNALQRYAIGQNVMLLVDSPNATRWVILPMQ